MKETTDQLLQYLRRGIIWVSGFLDHVWTWSADQIVKLTQTPWETWPLWRQILLGVVVALVAWALLIVAKQLWGAIVKLLAAVLDFIGALMMTLPTLLIAGALALAGLWAANNFHDLSSLRSIIGT